jgi:hypothetical protein
MTDKGIPGRYPHLGRLSVAILENFVKPIIGEKAIDEVKAPVAEKELKAAITMALQNTEERLSTEYADPEFCEALLSLPLADLPTTLQNARTFYSKPTDSTLSEFLKQNLLSSFPRMPSERVEAGVSCYIGILREEFANISNDIRGKLNTLATLNIENNVAQMAKSLDRVLEYMLSSQKAAPDNLETSHTKDRLKLTKKGLGASLWSYETTERIVGIGRAPDNDVVLEDPDVSWYHGYIERITGRYQYHHISNTNPAIVRRSKQEYLLSRKRQPEIALQNNDRIIIGKITLVVEFDIIAGPTGYVTTEDK